LNIWERLGVDPLESDPAKLEAAFLRRASGAPAGELEALRDAYRAASGREPPAVAAASAPPPKAAPEAAPETAPETAREAAPEAMPEAAALPPPSSPPRPPATTPDAPYGPADPSRPMPTLDRAPSPHPASEPRPAPFDLGRHAPKKSGLAGGLALLVFVVLAVNLVSRACSGARREPPNPVAPESVPSMRDFRKPDGTFDYEAWKREFDRRAR